MAAPSSVCKNIPIGSKVVHSLLRLVLLVLVSLSPHHVGVEGLTRTISKEEDLELEAQLKILNKPSIKTIHTEWGEIYDCVNIHKQPAFDHPLLKNHKIQMNPSLDTSGVKDKTSFPTSKSKKLRSRRRVEGCLKGTVPIRRTSKEDLIRAKSFQPNQLVADEVAAELIYQETGKTYFGAKGEITVYNPAEVGQDQYSTGEIGLISGPDHNYSGIRFGWMVNPKISGDNSTWGFTYWTADGGRTTGCFNTLCPGFVQVSKNLVPGSPLTNISVRGGPQFPIIDYVYQSNETKDWWLQYEGEKVGYFPNVILPLLSVGAKNIHWGGRVRRGSVVKRTPEMGSGYWPDEHFDHGSVILNMQYLNNQNLLKDVEEKKFEDRVGCYLYDAEYRGYHDGVGQIMSFGGSGGVTC